ncbi:MAG: UDP-N-acetylmuramate dehydrogenase [Clostridiales bacterium]|nr:UDP-N-acetylmuramate dehydrogenase [Clostridiales bacterium]
MDYNLIFTDFVKDGKMEFDVPMKEHTTFKIGGPADAMFFPENENDIWNCVKICEANKIKHFIMGNGSNLLVSDEGIRGLVIRISKNMDKVELVRDSTIYAGAGISLAKLAAFAYENELSGLEFASGIPGTLGGGVTMNAGAYDGEMKDVVSGVNAVDTNGKKYTFNNSQMKFNYRTSAIQGSGLIVTGAEIKLIKGDKTDIANKMADLNNRRKDKQPLELPSGGSTFKRPEGYYAAKLIEEAGLKGYAIGGACVSSKHAGFIVNTGNACCEDVRKLIDHVRNVVYEKHGILLETEVKMAGD